MSRIIKGKLQKLPKRPKRKGPATTLGLSFNFCVAVTPHSMYSVYHQLCCCLLDGVNRPAEQRICQMFLAGFRIQSEILTDLRTLQFQQIAVSFFVTRIIDCAWGVTKSKTWDPQRAHTPGKTRSPRDPQGYEFSVGSRLSFVESRFACNNVRIADLTNRQKGFVFCS